MSSAITTPLTSWTPTPAQIVGFVDETEDTRTYDLVLTEERAAARYRAAPGQFNMLYVPGVGESAISLSETPNSDGVMRHTVRAVGNVTHALARMQVGDTIGLRGPFGTSWPVDQLAGQHVVIVTGGIGLAPLRPLILELCRHRDQYARVDLLIGARDPSGLLYGHEYDDWRSHGIDVALTVDRATPGWTGDVGVVTLLLERLALKNPSETQVLMCGPEVMMFYAVDAARERGVPEQKTWVSLERHMNCAIGLCGHCQLGPEFICKDGPVLPYSRVAPYLRVEGL